MNDVAVAASMRRMRIVACAAAGVPAVVSSGTSGISPITVPSGTGVMQVTDSEDAYLSVGGGCAPYLLILPCNTGASSTHTVTVYGMRLVGNDWHPILLCVMSAQCDITVSSASAATNSIQNGDRVASAITVSSSGSTSIVTSGSSNPATVRVPTFGCPYVVFTASASTTPYVAVAPQY